MNSFSPMKQIVLSNKRISEAEGAEDIVFLVYGNKSIYLYLLLLYIILYLY